ncbi:MAG TPA: metallophosphoesterase [Phycisphaerae bacterium]|jgi:3',5'-cyclic AMP phosphodiesterase CpdA|nr:alkaline phosphatase [Phycisphaerae bacterium]HOB76226.1 metallophosphoesterase [Phycisphaerae bacterium]HOJ56200.1 metallophosphoesterase [Phycisphaerae bacterium]HOL28074.1 metallophosphoesterase [Phycisphaerae bacterium]HPP22432.1 metallophosphoesterase [Phycisphaerae bacterium]
MAAGRERISRRTALRRSSLFVAGAAGMAWPGCTHLRRRDARPQSPLRIGIVTDVHYADKDTLRERHYRASLTKLAEAMAHFNELKADFVIELGDFIDAAASPEEELGWLKRIDSVFAQARCPRHYVLGNHCVQTLTKEQFLSQCGRDRSYYSFEVGGFHFVVLDGCFRQDGQPYGNRNSEWTDSNIPPAELDWLEADLAQTRRPVVVFVHQRLDVDNHYAVRQQAEVRRRLEASGKVLAVLQGHYHAGDFREINGIRYCTLKAMVESKRNAYALLTLQPEGAIRMDGYGRQESRDL